MHGNSTPVRSTQRDVHAQLQEQVQAHLGSPWLRPIASHTRRAFQTVSARAAAHSGPLLIDAGCGTGDSTRQIAERGPGSLVFGVDKSRARLGAANPEEPEEPAEPDVGLGGDSGGGEMILLRADLRDFWRLALAEGWRPERQYIFYPNPWPKPGQLARRWHAHPVFPCIVALGGQLELRSNWRIYVDELALALSLCGVRAEIEPVPPSASDAHAVSPFERKYLASGQRCWRLLAQLDQAELPVGRTELVATISGR